MNFKVHLDEHYFIIIQDYFNRMFHEFFVVKFVIVKFFIFRVVKVFAFITIFWVFQVFISIIFPLPFVLIFFFVYLTFIVIIAIHSSFILIKLVAFIIRSFQVIFLPFFIFFAFINYLQLPLLH